MHAIPTTPAPIVTDPPKVSVSSTPITGAAVSPVDEFFGDRFRIGRNATVRDPFAFDVVTAV